MRYEPKKIEKKWQKIWEKSGHPKPRGKKGKCYILDMFPYPSGDGLHVGHVENFTATDIYARFMRFQGYDVLHPMGWDAFGLPAENFAIKTGIHPDQKTKQSIQNFTRQIKSIGLSYDWDREINTSSPDYYRFTQWMFLFLYKHGLAYKKKASVNWCRACQTVLANEQVVDGKCERSGDTVVQKDLEQWFFKITDFIEPTRSKTGKKISGLLSGLEKIDWPTSTKLAQKNWIGKSEGAEVVFPVALAGAKPNFLILHGHTGRANKNFIPWLKQSLEKQGYRVTAPDLPHTDNPTEEEQMKFVLKHCEIDENTVIVGHSLGAIGAMAIVEKLKHPIRGLVLVATAMSPDFAPKSKIYHQSFAWKRNYALLKRQCGFIQVISDTRETHRVAYLESLARQLDAMLVVGASEKEHFTAQEEPLLLDALVPVLKVFTTRLDTIYGCTYVVVAPEHPLVKNVESRISNLGEVKKYLEQTKRKTDLERTELNREKTGVCLQGIEAVHPFTGERLPVYVADYVLATYGTGAVMGVPAHDERDFKFAKKHNLPIKKSIDSERNYIVVIEESLQSVFYEEVARFSSAETRNGLAHIFTDDVDRVFDLAEQYFIGGPWYIHSEGPVKKILFHTNTENKRFDWSSSKGLKEAYDYGSSRGIEKGQLDWSDPYEATTEDGVLSDSDEFSGLTSAEAREKMAQWLKKEGLGKKVVNYRLRDWLISRQRYWGAPIPIIYCDDCGAVPVPEKDLPVKLPTDVDFRPTGESPLVRSKSFHRVKCPKCGTKARRESDTMDTFVCSSWYYLRFADPKNTKTFASKRALKQCLPVDFYMGGAEHTVLHLLYARFFTKALMKYGHLDFDEPFMKLRHQGIILGEDGNKMSKSKGNVVNPDQIVAEFGADSLRLYEMFMGPLDEMKAWNTASVVGLRRFLERVWRLQSKVQSPNSKVENRNLESILHKTIKKVTEDIEGLKFNTAISALMILLNEMEKAEDIPLARYEVFLVLLSPFAPHMAEELWHLLGEKKPIFLAPWPTYDPKKIVDDMVTIAVQVNGKVRATLSVANDADEATVKAQALADPKVQTHLAGKTLRKAIYVPGKILSLVV